MAKRRKKRKRPELDDRHRLAIEMLTTVPTENLEDIAKSCGVDRRTLYRWRLRKDFQRELQKVQERKSNAYWRRVKLKTTKSMDMRELERIMNALR